MNILSLSLRNFRNYSEQIISFNGNLNIFLGPNAQGKTNIVEAVSLASFGKSYRGGVDSDLVKWDQTQGSMKMIFSRKEVKNSFDAVFFKQGRKQIMANGQRIRTKELIGSFNTVIFSPEDLLLVKGSPAGRRNFLDRELSQASPPYYHELLRYNNIVSQRNALLKNIREAKASSELLASWDSQMVASAVRITVKRLQAISKLNNIASLMHSRISGDGETLRLDYHIHGMTDDDRTKPLNIWYEEQLKMNKDTDIIRGATGVGPHHDDIVFTINGVNLRSYGSQGQQRTAVLSVKLAELDFLLKETGEYPVLLLDDVMSELDPNRRRSLLNFITGEGIQTIVTATDEAYFPPNIDAVFFDVFQGSVTKR